MSHQSSNNRFQPLSLYTNSPIRMDYNRELPPLADQPLLELRRPANKDACFAISALSPTISKRFGGDWDSMSGRTSLLDRYLGQQAISPIIQELPPNPGELAPPSPAPHSRSYAPANPKALWTLMAQSQIRKVAPDRPSGAASVPHHQQHQKAGPDRSTQAASAAQRRRRERGPPPPLPPPVPVSTRSRGPQGQRTLPPATSSTRSRDNYERKASPPTVSRFSPPQEEVKKGRGSPTIVLPSTELREDPGKATSKSRPPQEDKRRWGSPPSQFSQNFPIIGHGSQSSPPSKSSQVLPKIDLGTRASPSVVPLLTSSKDKTVRKVSPPAVPSSTDSSNNRGRRSPPVMSHYSQSRDDRQGVGGESMVHRLEGFPIPRALSMMPDDHIPIINESITSSLASSLEQLGRESSYSRVDSWIGPPLTEQNIPPRVRDAPRYPGLPPAPNAKLKSYVPKIKTVRFAGSKTSEGSLKSPTVYSYTSYSNASYSNEPSPTTFSPVTPVAMTFEYPTIFEAVPPMEHVPWDDNLDIIEESPQDSVLSANSSKAVIISPDHEHDWSRISPKNPGNYSRPRARSHSPPRTPFPGDSPLHALSGTIFTPIEQHNQTPHQRQAPKDDFDLTYDVSEEITDGVRLLDRTAIWVLSGKTKDTTEKRQMVSLGDVGNDRDAILKSYFNRC